MIIFKDITVVSKQSYCEVFTILVVKPKNIESINSNLCLYVPSEDLKLISLEIYKFFVRHNRIRTHQ